MIQLFVKLLKIESLDTDKQRSAYGKICGLVGIMLNVVLFVGKFFAGILSNSIAITADAFNNLSDAGSSVVTLAGFKMAERKPDPNHPYGHGRMEYLAGLLVSAVIIMMAFELLKDAIHKILHPSDVQFSYVVVGILFVSILVKCYMAFYNYHIGKKIDSATLKATATDCLSDCVSTAAVLFCMIIGQLTSIQIDGFCGVAVAILIFIAGLNAAKETLNPLLGQAADPDFVKEIERTVLEFDEQVIGVHDMMIHDYGPGRRVISLHAEVPAESDILKIHDIIDNLEVKLKDTYGCLTTIHMDPVITSDERVSSLKRQCQEIVKEVDERVSLHDFRVVFGDTHTNLIFDIVVSFDSEKEDEEIAELIETKIKEKIGPKYFAKIQVDKSVV